MMRSFIQSGASVDSADINYAYIAIKLWLLLAQKKSELDASGNVIFASTWNELWPPFEHLVNTLENQFEAGQIEVIASL